MCGDGITADPTGGQPAEPPGPTEIIPPPTEIPAPQGYPAYVTAIEVTGNVVDFSFEGQRPNLNGVQLNVYWSDSGMQIISGRGLSAEYYTSPAILGQAQLASWVKGGEAAYDPGLDDQPYPVQIEVFHYSNPGAKAVVLLPGVNAIDTSYSIDGYQRGFSVGGNIPAFYEDGEVDLSSVTVRAWYKGLTKPIPYDVYPDPDPVANMAPGSQLITLNKDYIFPDYWDTFPTGAWSAATKYYAYGINPAQKSGNITAGTGLGNYLPATMGARAGTVWILISKAGTDALHKQANSDSKYIVAPLNRFNFVRYVEVEREPSWVAAPAAAASGLNPATPLRDYWYADDWTLSSRLENNTANPQAADALKPVGGLWGTWWTAILDSEMTFKVYYYNEDYDADLIPQTRDRTHLVRAMWNGNAGISALPNFRLLEDEGPEAVTLRLSYYGSPVVGYVPGKVGSGSYPNEVLGIQIPLATFNEEIGFDRGVNTVNPKPLQWISTTAAVPSFPTALLTDIRAHYRLLGYYTRPDGQPAIPKVITGLLTETWFTSYRELGRRTDNVIENLDLEVTVPRNVVGLPSTAYVGLTALPTVTIEMLPAP